MTISHDEFVQRVEACQREFPNSDKHTAVDTSKPF